MGEHMQPGFMGIGPCRQYLKLIRIITICIRHRMNAIKLKLEKSHRQRKLQMREMSRAKEKVRLARWVSNLDSWG